MCLAIQTGRRGGKDLVMVRSTRDVNGRVRTDAGWKTWRRVHPAVWKSEVPGEVYGAAA
jgi:hypothetical protein